MDMILKIAIDTNDGSLNRTFQLDFLRDSELSSRCDERPFHDFYISQSV